MEACRGLRHVQSHRGCALGVCHLRLLGGRHLGCRGPFLIRLRLSRVPLHAERGAELVCNILRLLARAAHGLVVSAVVQLVRTRSAARRRLSPGHSLM